MQTGIGGLSGASRVVDCASEKSSNSQLVSLGAQWTFTLSASRVMASPTAASVTVREATNTTFTTELDSQEQVVEPMPMYCRSELQGNTSAKPALSVALSKVSVKKVPESANLATERVGSGFFVRELITVTVRLVVGSNCAALAPVGVSTTVYVPATRDEPMNKKPPPGLAAVDAMVVEVGARVSLFSPVVGGTLPVESYRAALMVTEEAGGDDSE
mmetsp:Transcript_16314/g.35666  ORF Transcript_16314/g.35666 Transcript_16314/m.35666 type:complete len:216 (+) Transcript_16314:422-1069(+)